MRIESEAALMFAAGVLIVLLAEIVIGLTLPKRSKERRAMLGHSLCLLLAVFLLGSAKYAPEDPYGGPCDVSGLLALFGITWFAAECFVIGALTKKSDGDEQ